MYLNKYRKSIFERLKIWQHFFRYREKSTDILLASFPRSGNTYVRFMLSSYIKGRAVDFLDFHKYIPDIHANPSDISALQSPRIIKTHFPRQRHRARGIYIVRDPRDVLVSYYYYSLKVRAWDEKLGFDRFCEAFLSGQVGEFGAWDKHVESWMEASDKIRIFKYEEIILNPLNALEGMINFIGMSADQGRTIASVEAARFERMQSLETKQHGRDLWLKNTRNDIPFVRKARPGEWQNLCKATHIREINTQFKKLMTHFGYEV